MLKLFNSRIYNILIFVLMSSLLLIKTYVTPLDYTDIVFAIFSILSILSIFIARDGSPFITLGTFSLLHPFKSNLSFNNVPISVIAFVIIYVISIIIFIIKNKVNIWVGKLKYGLLIFVVIIIISSFRLSDTYPSYLLLILLIPVFYLFFYLFVSSSLKGDKRIYIGELFMLAGVFLSIHAINYVVNNDINLIVEYMKKGISRAYYFPQVNITAIILNITLLTSVSLVVLKPKNIIYQLSIVLQVFAMIITASRAGILLAALFLFISLFIIYLKRPSNFYFYSRITFIFITLFIALVPTGLFINMYNHFIESFKSSDPTTGRIDLIKEALEIFKTSPLLGKGILGIIEVKVVNGTTLYSFYSYHNFIVQALAMMGVIGLIGCIIHLIDIIRVLFKKVDSYRMCFILLALCLFINALVDNVFFMIHSTIYFFIIIAMLEAYDLSKLSKSNTK